MYYLTSLIRVSSSVYSADARFVITGSDDGIVRIWKAKASDKLGIITPRERAAIEYRESLKERWKVDAEVERVMRYAPVCSNDRRFLTLCCRTRHLPKSVQQAAKLKRTMLEARRVKEERRRKHTRAGESKPEAEKKTAVIVEQA
jgi:WD repeat and SOF domain-containing protein 1